MKLSPFFPLALALCLHAFEIEATAELASGNAPFTETYEPARTEITDTSSFRKLTDQEMTWTMAGAGLFTGILIHWFHTRAKRRRRVVKVNAAFLLGAGLFSFSPTESKACLNVEYKLLDESYLRLTQDNGSFSGTVGRALAASPIDDPHAKENPTAYPSPPPAGIRENDAAVREILHGNFSTALLQLQKIEAEQPGLYETAANLGTAYELTGDDANGLKWIKEGIRRNPKSHMLAEWLHVKVLEAKLALAADPSWFDTHTITGMNPSKNSFETLQGKKDRSGVIQAFRSQCTVRALFIKPKNDFMARLLYEAATFLSEQDKPAVNATLDLAEQYGMKSSDTADLRAKTDAALAAYMKRNRLDKAEFIAKWKHPAIFGLAILVGFLLPKCRLSKNGQAAGI